MIKRIFYRAIAALLLLYAAAGVGFMLFELSLLFHPTARPLSECNLPAGVRHLTFGGEQGLLTETGANRLVVFWHGNGSDACNWRYLGPNHLAPLGYDTLVMEFPGYAGDQRPVGKQTLLQAAENAAVWAERYSSITVIGFSMGSAPASWQAAKGADALLLFAPFSSMLGLLRDKGFWFPAIMLRNDFDNASTLSGTAPPTVLIHGAEDTLIPPDQSAILAEAIKDGGGMAEQVIVPNIGHNGLFANEILNPLLARYL